MKLTGAQIVTEVLIEQGATTVFGYPGGTVLNVYEALYEKRDVIAHYLPAHEQGAAHAADGYARATGKTGVVIATSGPGATNLVTGIATAYMDSIPMVAITCNVGTPYIGKDSFQEVYIAGITLPITKHNYVVMHVEDLADTIRNAFIIANSGRKGPVLVDIPKDITANLCEFTPKAPASAKKKIDIPTEEIQYVADLINESKNPVICFGGGVISGEASKELIELIRKADIPATHTIMGTGVLSYDDPLNIGMVGMHGSVMANKAVDQAELLLAIGMRFSDRVALNVQKFARHAKIVHIDIDPSEISKNVVPYYGLVGDIKVVLSELLPRVNKASHKEWTDVVCGWKVKDYMPCDRATQIRPKALFDSIAKFIGEDTIIVTDVGQHQIWAAQYCRNLKPRGFLTSGGLGTMGFGYGAAIGAKIGMPDKRVIHITGDGCFHMNLIEACTAVSNNLPIITIICNNRVLGMVRQWQTSFYHKHYSATDPERKTDFCKVAEGYGLKGFRANTMEKFDEAFKKALKENGPVWIDCTIDKDEKVLPMIPSGRTVDDIILE